MSRLSLIFDSFVCSPNCNPTPLSVTKVTAAMRSMLSGEPASVVVMETSPCLFIQVLLGGEEVKTKRPPRLMSPMVPERLLSAEMVALPLSL